MNSGSSSAILDALLVPDMVEKIEQCVHKSYMQDICTTIKKVVLIDYMNVFPVNNPMSVSVDRENLVYRVEPDIVMKINKNTFELNLVTESNDNVVVVGGWLSIGDQVIVSDLLGVFKARLLLNSLLRSGLVPDVGLVNMENIHGLLDVGGLFHGLTYTVHTKHFIDDANERLNNSDPLRMFNTRINIMQIIIDGLSALYPAKKILIDPEYVHAWWSALMYQ